MTMMVDLKMINMPIPILIKYQVSHSMMMLNLKIVMKSMELIELSMIGDFSQVIVIHS